MVDGKQKKPGARGTAHPEPRAASGPTIRGEPYLPGDALPEPEVVEKNTDSVWALWSDMVEGTPEPTPSSDKDFKETVPMDFDIMEQTQLMDLPDLEDDDKRHRGR
jgi:hypothetical protein